MTSPSEAAPAPEQGTPTGYFLASTPGINDDQPYSAARWYWPDSTDVEIWDAGSKSWVLNDSFLSINDDPKWETATEEQVTAWTQS